MSEITTFIKEIEENKPLESKFIYSEIQNFLKEGDIIFSETGLIEFGFATLELPKNAHLYNQVLWGSIGWATPAAFGAAIAEKNKRLYGKILWIHLIILHLRTTQNYLWYLMVWPGLLKQKRVKSSMKPYYKQNMNKKISCVI